MAEGGVRELAARWRDLQSPEWRENLVSEIGQAFPEWVDEGAIELLIAALEQAIRERLDRSSRDVVVRILEVNSGFFQRHGVAVGDFLLLRDLLSRAKSAA